MDSSNQFAPPGLLHAKFLHSNLLLLHHDSYRYMFNAPPMTLRISQQSKVKMIRVNKVFITGNGDRNCLGLPGWWLTQCDSRKSNEEIVLHEKIEKSHHSANSHIDSSKLSQTLKSIEEEKMDIFGPMDLFWSLNSLKWFVKRDNLHIKVHELEPSTSWIQVHSDELCTIKSFVYSGEKRTQLQNAKRKRVTNSENNFHMERKDGISFDSIPSGTDLRCCYAVHINPSKGRFLVEKARQLGIKPGPIFGRLQKGENVHLDSGEIITPDQVIGPPIPGPIMLIISCEHPKYSEEFFEKNNFFKPYFQGEEYDEHLVYVIHMVHDEVWNSDLYRSFVSNFSGKVKHILSNDRVFQKRDVFHGSAELQCKLHVLDPIIFPLVSPLNVKFDSNLNDKKKREHEADNLLTLRILPSSKIGIDTNQILAPLEFEKIKKQLLQDQEIARLVDEYQKEKKDFEWDRLNPHEKLLSQMSDHEAEIAFLGTGSALPSKYRNVTGMYLNLFDRGGLFMDCGEGSLCQLTRVYGREETRRLIQDLKCIWISHMHADHHMGIVDILIERKEIARQSQKPLSRLVIIGPARLGYYLEEIRSTFEFHTDFTFDFVLCTDLLPDSDPLKRRISFKENSTDGDDSEFLSSGEFKSNNIMKKLCEDLGMEEFYNIHVNHSCQAFALILKSIRGWKLVFSGDTRPCMDLVTHGQDATVLIHEATHEDSLMSEAIEKKHSTTSEAVFIGQQMKAYRTILTHFSQRYPKIPKFSDDSNHEHGVDEKVGIAFDICRLNLKDLKVFPRSTKALRKLFEEEFDDE